VLLDYQQYFTQSEFYLIKNYTKVIAQPIDLCTMLGRVETGCYDENTAAHIRQDFLLMISNATTFNMPNSKPFKEARRLRVLGLQAFHFFRFKLELDEMDLLSFQKEEYICRHDRAFFAHLKTCFLDIVFSKKEGDLESDLVAIRIRECVPDKDREADLIQVSPLQQQLAKQMDQA